MSDNNQSNQSNAELYLETLSAIADGRLEDTPETMQAELENERLFDMADAQARRDFFLDEARKVFGNDGFFTDEELELLADELEQKGGGHDDVPTYELWMPPLGDRELKEIKLRLYEDRVRNLKSELEPPYATQTPSARRGEEGCGDA